MAPEFRRILDGFGGAERGGHEERRPAAEFDRAGLDFGKALGLRDSVDGSAFGKQEPDGFDITIPRGVHERCQADECVGRVDIGVGVEKQADGGGVVSERGGVERRDMARIHDVDPRAFGEEKLHDFGGGVGEGGDDEGGASAAGGGVDRRVVIEQQADFGRIGNRPHERGGTEIVLRVDVGAAVDEQAHGVERADFGGVHQGSDAAVVGDVGIGVGVEEGFELGEIVFADGRVEVFGGGFAGGLFQSLG